MKKYMKSGICFFVVWFLLLEIISRRFIVNHAFFSTYDEIDRLNYAFSRRTIVPEVVYLGSSKTQADVATITIASNLGLPLEAVLNASVAAASPREMLYIYTINEQLFRSARVVYINVDLWMFNKHFQMAEKNGPPAWRRSAGLMERIEFSSDLTTKADWILGWAIATWDQRATWRSLWRSWLRNPWTHNVAPVYDCFGRPVQDYLIGEHPFLSQMLEEEAPQIVNSHMQSYAFNSDALLALEALVFLVRANGAEPVLLKMPAAPQYMEYQRANFSAFDFVWQKLSARFPGVDILDLPSEAAQLERDDWWDAYHLTRVGAMKMAIPLAEDLRKRLGP
ncbi:MAG: hypothetical protein FD169_1973 [Bacillota bacterium]|nr:MAG: hypothetical protein FD169_1973 [Bacillota bacterium]MBS3949885.1 hypothetical protein [Peptococcaceae bacterium]